MKQVNIKSIWLLFLAALFLLQARVAAFEMNMDTLNNLHNAVKTVQASLNGEQVIFLSDHYTYDEIAAISFPSRNVHIQNPDQLKELGRLTGADWSTSLGPYHVICSMEEHGLECVSSLEERGLFIDHATLSDECFEPASRDDRFVIANPIRKNACVLNATIGTKPGYIELALDKTEPAPRTSVWSVDASAVQSRVNAYKALVAAMKNHNVDFTNQILRKTDMPFGCDASLLKLARDDCYPQMKYTESETFKEFAEQYHPFTAFRRVAHSFLNALHRVAISAFPPFSFFHFTSEELAKCLIEVRRAAIGCIAFVADHVAPVLNAIAFSPNGIFLFAFLCIGALVVCTIIKQMIRALMNSMLFWFSLIACGCACIGAFAFVVLAVTYPMVSFFLQ